MSCDLVNLATPGIAKLEPYQAGKSIQELAHEYGISKIIKLASNENPLGASKQAKQILSAVPDVSRYPDGNGHSLKLALAKYHNVNVDQITLGNGSNEIFELITRAIADQTHEIIFSAHAFAVYPLVTQAINATALVINDKNWVSDTVAMQSAIGKNSRILFIANPNNPTGTWVDSKALRKLLENIPKHMVVVVDEAYFEYVQEEDYPNCIEWVHEFEQLVVTRTFSKIFGLAGLRIGYAVSHSAIADLMNRVRQPFNVNSLAMSAAEVAISDIEHVQQSIQLNHSGMQQLIDAFNGLGLEYIPSVGNFICVAVGCHSLKVYQQLLRKGIIVRPLSNYGMPNHLRITIGLSEENTRFIEAFEIVLAEMDRS